MSKKKTNKKTKRRLVILGFGSLVLIIAMLFVLGSYWYEIYLMYKEKDTLEEELLSLRDQEEELEVDVAKLEDPEYIARYAREKYLFSKEDEIILKIE